MQLNKSISIATITWARDPKEDEILRKSLKELSKLNLPVFITDGGSNEDFIKFLKSLENCTVIKSETKGLVSQVNCSMQAAYESGSQFIFYTEPDKLSFFSNHLLKVLSQISADEHTGIILMSRSVKGFASFPSFQQMTETTINNCCTEVIGKVTDYTYGPFLINRKLVPYLNHVKENIGWGWRPYMFTIAKRTGMNIESVTKDFYCPEEQQKTSENIYRIKQLEQNLQGLLLSTTAEIKLPEDFQNNRI